MFGTLWRPGRHGRRRGLPKAGWTCGWFEARERAVAEREAGFAGHEDFESVILSEVDGRV